MGIISNIREWLVNTVFYNARDIEYNNLIVNSRNTYLRDAIVNKTFYRGFADEIDKVMGESEYYVLDTFWGSNAKLKRHSGINGTIINMMGNVVSDDFLGIEVIDNKYRVIEEKIKFNEYIDKIVTLMCSEGECVAKIVPDEDNIRLELVGGTDVRYNYKHNKLESILIKTRIENEGIEYLIVEEYGKGYIKYGLGDKEGNDISEKEELEKILGIELNEECIYYTGVETILAEKFSLNEGLKYKGRGTPLLSGKIDIIDAYDELISENTETLRYSKPTRYVPNMLAPKGADGRPIKDVFNRSYIVLGPSKSINGEEKIQVDVPEIRDGAYKTNKEILFEMIIEGVISSSTLGINNNSKASAESQREREKSTIYTRNKIVVELDKGIKSLIEKILNIYGYEVINREGIRIKWGEYAGLGFEDRLRILGEAYEKGIISIDKVISELWGDTLDLEGREKEKELIKQEIAPEGTELEITKEKEENE